MIVVQLYTMSMYLFMYMVMYLFMSLYVSVYVSISKRTSTYNLFVICIHDYHKYI